jgi:hypothetical protein
MAKQNNAVKLLLVFLVGVAAFFILSALIMVTWNYTVPRLAESVDSSYSRVSFKNIDYPVAIVFTILVTLIFGSGTGKWVKSGNQAYDQWES